MQTKITGQTPLFALVPVPYEVLADADIDVNEPLQFTADNGRITIENISAEDIDIICGGNCGSCPAILIDCTGKCAICPCNKKCNEREAL